VGGRGQSDDGGGGFKEREQRHGHVDGDEQRHGQVDGDEQRHGQLVRLWRRAGERRRHQRDGRQARKRKFNVSLLFLMSLCSRCSSVLQMFPFVLDVPLCSRCSPVLERFQMFPCAPDVPLCSRCSSVLQMFPCALEVSDVPLNLMFLLQRHIHNALEKQRRVKLLQLFNGLRREVGLREGTTSKIFTLNKVRLLHGSPGSHGSCVLVTSRSVVRFRRCR